MIRLMDSILLIFFNTCNQQTRQCHTKFYRVWIKGQPLVAPKPLSQNGCKNENSLWTYFFHSRAIKNQYYSSRNPPASSPKKLYPYRGDINVSMVGNLSWKRRQFALSKDGKKVWPNVLFRFVFVPFRLFCHICETTVCWEPEILLPPWRTDFSARFFRCLRFSGIKEREISVSLTNKKCFTFIKC